MFRALMAKRMTVSMALVCVLGTTIFGCATNAQNNSLIGAGVGAAIGNWIGEDTEGTLWGAGIGATAGLLLSEEEEESELTDDSAALTDEEP